MIAMHGLKLAGCLAAAAAAAVVAAGPAQALTDSPSSAITARVGATADIPPGLSPAGALGIHCGTPSLNDDGYQWYYEVSCSVWGGTTWSAHISCSDGSTRTSGPHSSFRNVQVYCPPNTTAIKGWVSYSG
ncbi:hypothetical protein HPT28_21030 [Streptomyces sp. JJ38]|nr:hypothetical protein [Streptomyces sp. JJ38]